MSRIGKMPIAIPAGVTVEIAENNKVTVKGPKGTLERVLPSEMDIKMEGSEIVVSRPNDLTVTLPPLPMVAPVSALSQSLLLLAVTVT